MAARTILTQRTASAVWRTRAAALLQFQGTRCRTRNLRDEPRKIVRSLHPHRRCRNRICRRWKYAPKPNSRWAVTLGTDARGTPRRIWRARSAPGLGPSPRIYSEFLKRERGRNSEKSLRAYGEAKTELAHLDERDVEEIKAHHSEARLNARGCPIVRRFYQTP